MRATTTAATDVVSRWLTSVPITSLLRQKMSSGMSANGMPNERTTWLMTSERLGCETNGKHDQGRHHGYDTAQEQRYLPVDEPLHHDLPAEGTDGRTGQPRSQQRDPEQDGGGAAFEDTQLLEGLVYVADAGQSCRMKEGGGHNEHARIDGPRDGHCDDHVDQLEAEDPTPLLLRLSDDPALRERRVKIDYVRHDRGPEYPRRQKHALGPGEPGREEPGEYPVGLGLGVEHLEGEGYDDDPDHGGDDRFQRPETPPLQLEYSESPHRREQAGREEWYPEEQVEGQGRPYKLG